MPVRAKSTATADLPFPRRCSPRCVVQMNSYHHILGLVCFWARPAPFRPRTRWKPRSVYGSKGSVVLNGKVQNPTALTSTLSSTGKLCMHPLKYQLVYSQKLVLSPCFELKGQWNKTIKYVPYPSLYLCSCQPCQLCLSVSHLSKTQQHPIVGTVSCCIVSQMSRTWKCRLCTSVHDFVFKYNFAVEFCVQMHWKQ